MRWVVGIDLRPLSAGAIRFCTWLRETSRARDGEVFLAVHVLEQRAARRDGKGIVRLGRVARRLLRSAAGPVVVAPPDLESGHLGTGPVVALTSLRADSVEACRFGASVAELLGRELAVVHVAPVPKDFGRSHLPIRSLDSIREDYRARAERGLQEWIAANAPPAGNQLRLAGILDGPLAPARGAAVRTADRLRLAPAVGARADDPAQHRDRTGRGSAGSGGRGPVARRAAARRSVSG